jgi:hypothetical protein
VKVTTADRRELGDCCGPRLLRRIRCGAPRTLSPNLKPIGTFLFPATTNSLLPPSHQYPTMPAKLSVDGSTATGTRRTVSSPRLRLLRKLSRN